MNYKTLLIAATTAALLFSGCENRSTDLQDSLVGNTVEDKIAGFAVFNPTEGLIPYPNNILFAPNSSSTDDYDYGQTLNIPYEPTDADAAIKEQLNALTGFSTISPITAPITATLDLLTIMSGVQVYKVDLNATGAVTDINATLEFGVDYVATQSGSNVAILPLRPLESLSNYMVVLTNDLKDAQGRVLAPDMATALTLSQNPVVPGGSLDPATAAALEAIRQGNMAMFAALIADGKDPSNTVQIWNFRTQLIGAVQANIAALAPKNANLTLYNTAIDTVAALGLAPSGKARIYDGNLSGLVQYMPQSTTNNPTNALYGQFSLNGAFEPQVKSTITVPVVAFLPNADSGCTMPASGWPVVIYQHGITRVRTDLFVFGETLASICHAAVAMDLPLHGITETNTSINPFYKAGIERTFDFDLVTEDADNNVIANVPDGIVDSTGSFYINLGHVATTRDNMQQTTSDLLELEAALASANLDGNASLKFDPAKISFLAHSLGSIASTGYVNTTTALSTATLAMPGQGVIDIIRYSPVFSPAVNAGLAAVGIIEGTSTYNTFMLALQTIIDDADPANYSAAIGAGTLPILEIEAVGDGSEGSGDQHILNSIATAPLAGTEPFIYFSGAVDINTSALVATPGGDLYYPSTSKTVARLTAGEHRSPLDPQYSVEATTEIHTELASFISSQGTAIQVVYPSIIQQ